MPGEQRAQAGALAADARQGIDVGTHVGASTAVDGRNVETEDVVLARKLDRLVVESVFQVAEVLDRTDLPAERIDVGEQLVAGVGIHHRSDT